MAATKPRRRRGGGVGVPPSAILQALAHQQQPSQGAPSAQALMAFIDKVRNARTMRQDSRTFI